MPARVITVARQVGTQGEELARTIALRIGFRYIDYQIIQDAAHEAGVSPETVSDAEHTPSLMTRLLESLARTPSMPVAAWADPVPLATSPLLTSTDYRRFVEDVIRDLAEQGECVIVGHGAQVALRERPDTLRALITGSRKVRVKRIMQGMGVDEKAAQQTADRTDAERLDYFHRFYDTGWLSPWTYDLCLNTDHLSVEQATDVLVEAAKARA
jgi:cytidylate kinase